MQTTKTIKYIPGWYYCPLCNRDEPRTRIGHTVHMKQKHGITLCPGCGMDLSNDPFKTHSCGRNAYND